jgi:hypothetical protein
MTIFALLIAVGFGVFAWCLEAFGDWLLGPHGKQRN